MQSDKDLLAQWTGEELFAAGRAANGERMLHRRRGEFFFDILNGLKEGARPAGATPIRIESEMGKLLNQAFRISRS